MAPEKLSPQQLSARLSHFCGSEELFRHWLGGMLYTEGVKFLAEQAGAYWLIDAIASHQPKCRRDPMLQEFQAWTLTVKADRSARLVCERDSGDEAFAQDIEYSDFPLPEIKLFVENNTLLLPSEH